MIVFFNWTVMHSVHTYLVGHRSLKWQVNMLQVVFVDIGIFYTIINESEKKYFMAISKSV